MASGGRILRFLQQASERSFGSVEATFFADDCSVHAPRLVFLAAGTADVLGRELPLAQQTTMLGGLEGGCQGEIVDKPWDVIAKLGEPGETMTELSKYLVNHEAKSVEFWWRGPNTSEVKTVRPKCGKM